MTVIVSMLPGSGLGSALTERIPDDRVAGSFPSPCSRCLSRPAACLVVSCAFWLICYPFPGRQAGLVAVTILCVCGLCFPLSLRGTAPEVVPWAWASNGWASVAGGVGTLVVVRLVGFSAALGIALAAYAVALLIQWRVHRSRRAGHG